MGKYILKEKIILSLENENIIGFIIKEVDDSLEYLNKYKLQNIYDNIDLFIEDLKNISKLYESSLI